jgi:hypothetical protein
MDRTVSSSNGWNMGRGAPIWEQVDQGVTVSACGGPAYHGGPHITNATFWDHRILLRYLLRGRDLGECFLLSTYYVNWSTSLLGDPLLHPDLSRTVIDDMPPKVGEKEEIKIDLVPLADGYAGSMTIPIVSTAPAPEVARLWVRYSKQGEEKKQVSEWPIYSTRPSVVLRDLDPESTYFYHPILIDPYGNRTDLYSLMGPLSFETGPLPEGKIELHHAKKGRRDWKFNFWGLGRLSEHGTITVEFMAGKRGDFPDIVSENLSLKCEPWSKGRIKMTMQVGSPAKTLYPSNPLKEGKKATLVFRWRRHPLTREVLLRANNGKEFTFFPDVRTPWEERELRGPILIKEAKGVNILSAMISEMALPASEDASEIEVLPIKEEDWRKANGSPGSDTD